MNILCKLGIHKYTIVHEGKYTLYGVPNPTPKIRGCTRCFQEQKMHKVLLGMPPVDYVIWWETIHKGDK